MQETIYQIYRDVTACKFCEHGNINAGPSYQQNKFIIQIVRSLHHRKHFIQPKQQDSFIDINFQSSVVSSHIY